LLSRCSTRRAPRMGTIVPSRARSQANDTTAEVVPSSSATAATVSMIVNSSSLGAPTEAAPVLAGQEAVLQRAPRDEGHALVLGEVCVVLDVERGERNVADEPAGGDPGVVDRSRAATKLGMRLDLAPQGGSNRSDDADSTMRMVRATSRWARSWARRG
jgi:hypothetical protein